MRNFFRAILTTPLFNILLVIYAFTQEFGVSIILLTILVRTLLWPLMKKQLHNQKVMKEIQPELKKIKKRTKGDRQKEAQLMMELYKERGINPYASFGPVLIQLPLLLGLFYVVRGFVQEGEIANRAYDFLLNIETVKQLVDGTTQLNTVAFGVVDLALPFLSEFNLGALTNAYWPAFPLAAAAGLGQFLQMRQIQSKQGPRKSLKQLLEESAKSGKEPSPAEQTQAAMGSMMYFFPVLAFIAALTFPPALSLYWVTGSIIAILQQKYLLTQDVEEMEESVEEPKPKKGSA